jgi:hypothetical protein
MMIRKIFSLPSILNEIRIVYERLDSVIFLGPINRFIEVKIII